jgi:hypothetical protein
MVQRPLKRFSIHRKTKMSPVLCFLILGGQTQSDAPTSRKNHPPQNIFANA